MKDYYSRDKDDAYRQRRQAIQNPPEPEAKPPKKRFPWGKIVLVLIIILLVILIRYIQINQLDEVDVVDEKSGQSELPVHPQTTQPDED